MYANRYGGDRQLKPGSVAVALAINGGVLAAVLLAAPEIITKPKFKPFIIESITAPPPPPEKPHPIVKADPAPAQKPFIPLRIVADPAPSVDLTLAGAGDVTIDRVDDSGGLGTGMVIEPPLPPTPLFIDPELDQRYAGSFQPGYPPAERRLEREGSVTVRVLIGIDGRVKQIERLTATSDDFFAATRQAALARWRFRPGTRDGVAVERWKTIRVTFHLEED